MKENFEFDLPKVSKKDIIKKIVKRVILIMLVLSLVFVVIKKCSIRVNNNDFTPVAKNSIEDIKIKHDIEDGINVKNLDIEVYDNMTKTEEKKYNDVIIEKPEKRDGFFARIKSEKDDLRQDKIAKKLESQENEKKEMDKLKEEVGNERLIKNIKEGKDIKPSIKAQLSASSSRLNAERYWNRLKKSYPDIFKGLQYFIEVGNFGERGEIYRLQVGYFSDITEAKSFCNKFILHSKKNATDCIVVKN